MKLYKTEWAMIGMTAGILLLFVIKYFTSVPATDTFTITGAHAPQERSAATQRVYIPDELIDINTAGMEDLLTLPGIGESKALAILRYRVKNGPFARAEDLTKVSGIGMATYDKLAPYITASTPQEDPPEATAEK